MRITLKAINDELARRGATERLARANGYFYFEFGEAAAWLDRTVRVRTENALTLEQRLAEYQRLKTLNQEIMGGGTLARGAAPSKHPSKKGPEAK
jgi:hypothetical protein